jgi:hypothetical protein
MASHIVDTSGHSDGQLRCDDCCVRVSLGEECAASCIELALKTITPSMSSWKKFSVRSLSSILSGPLFRIESGLGPVAAGAFVQLYKSHQPFAVESEWVHILGESFATNGREDSVLTITGTTIAPHVMGATSRAHSP